MAASDQVAAALGGPGPSADHLGEGPQRQRGRRRPPEDSSHSDQTDDPGHEERSGCMGTGGTKTLISVGSQMAVHPLSRCQGAPRIGALDLDLDEPTPLVRSRPTSDRLIERREGGEVDDQSPDCQDEEPAGPVHRVEAKATQALASCAGGGKLRE